MRDAIELSTDQVVVFEAARHHFAVLLRDVVRAELAVALTAIPGAPDPILGAMILGQEPVPVLSMRQRLGLKPRNVRPSERIVVVSIGDRHVGLLVDSITGLRAGARVPSPDSLSPAESAFDTCIVDGTQIILIVDVRALLTDEQASQLDTLLSELGERTP